MIAQESAGGPPSSDPDAKPLAGIRVCLIFEDSLAHYHRILQEIEALEDAGASVTLVTSSTDSNATLPGIARSVTPLFDFALPCSTIRSRLLRIADNTWRSLVRPLLKALPPWLGSRRRLGALRSVARFVDVFWVIDYPSLPSALHAARKTGAKVIYETVDLVPEYSHLGKAHVWLSRAGERRTIGRVDGFITACDSYSDYYMEKYGPKRLTRRPVVCGNAPMQITSVPSPSSSPVRMLFFGALRFDRPVIELIESLALTESATTLTFLGANQLGDAPLKRIRELGLLDRVFVLPPCPVGRMVEVAQSYDVGIVALRGENENERRASTSKLCTYMAAGLAILGSNLPGIARTVNEYSNGILVDDMEPAGWAGAMDKIASMTTEQLDALKQRSLEAARQNSWEHQRSAFIGEFTRSLATTLGDS